MANTSVLATLARVVDAVERRQLGSATPQEIADFRRKFVPLWRQLQELEDNPSASMKQKATAERFFWNAVNNFKKQHPGFDEYADGRVCE